jgi:hypothetical protein
VAVNEFVTATLVRVALNEDPIPRAATRGDWLRLTDTILQDTTPSENHTPPSVHRCAAASDTGDKERGTGKRSTEPEGGAGRHETLLSHFSHSLTLLTQRKLSRLIPHTGPQIRAAYGTA